MTAKPELIRLAKLLTGSHDSKELIDTAIKLERYANASDIATSYNHPLLAALEADVVAFAHTLAIPDPSVGLRDLVLYDFQALVLEQIANSTDRTIAIASSRQMGWSTLLAVQALHFAATNDNTTQLLFAPSNYSAMDFADRVRCMLGYRPDISIRSMSKHEIELGNGSKIFCRAVDPNACRGLTLHKLMIMDAAYIAPSRLRDLLIALVPTLSSTSGQIIMQSTPNEAHDQFHRFCQSADLYIHQPWSLHPSRDASFATHHITMLGQARFDVEFEAKFV
jgi:hypothetical protein